MHLTRAWFTNVKCTYLPSDCIYGTYYFIVLMVEFASGQFTDSESSGFIEVIVRIMGGTSNTPITVTVTPSVQSPVSAMGMFIIVWEVLTI